MTRWWKLLSGPGAGILAYLALSGSDLSPEGRRLAAILACAVLWWMTEALPLAVSALLASSLCVLGQVAPAKKVLAPYADPIIFLFLGSFWIAEAMTAHGLGKRLAVRLLSVPALRRSPRRLILALGGVAAGISLWVSNTATTAMLLPIVLWMLAALPADSRDPLIESRMLLMLAFAASVGGLGTPVGTPPNLIGIGMLDRLAGIRVSFAGWMAFAMPITFVTLAFVGVLLSRDLAAPRGWSRLEEYLGAEERALKPMTLGEKNTLAAFLVAVALWLTVGEKLSEGVCALLAASLLFVLPQANGERTLTWERACRIEWGVILLFGGGLSLGQQLFDTKLAEWMGARLTELFGLRSAFGVAGASAGLAIVTSELASNTASANVAVPTALALSKSAGVSPALPAMAATLASSFGFLLPVSTAPNALVYATGKVPLKDMMKNGLALDIFGYLICWLGLSLFLG